MGAEQLVKVEQVYVPSKGKRMIVSTEAVRRSRKEEEYLAYKELGPLNEVREKVKKMTPAKPLQVQGNPVYGYCPSCGIAVPFWLNRKACKECLQALDWSEVNN